jgi:segregation and condensation protein B
MNAENQHDELIEEREPGSPEASEQEWQDAVDAIAAGDALDEVDEVAAVFEANVADDESPEMDPPEFESFFEEDLAMEGDEVEADEIRVITPDETASVESSAAAADEVAEPEEIITATREELKPAIEAILFVADEPLSFKHLCKVLGEVSEDDVRAALEELVAEYDARGSGLEFREIAGGWRISTRPQNHEFIRKYLKSRPSARLSLPALETLAVIAYKQPITVPEILEIRGVTSSSAIKTLLEKRLIVTKGRKETVGRPMMYGTSKEFLIQFGLKDLTELPSIEDFEDLAQ